jgi:PucR family transcriptional regulator, proline-responsive transcriptional activator
VQRELDELAEAIGHSVSVDDAGGVVVGYSVQGDDVDSVRVRAILTRRVPAEVLAYQRRHGVETASEPVEVPASEELGMAARLCIPLVRGRTRLGYLWILDTGEALRPAEIAVARKTAQRLAGLLQARTAAVRGVDALFGRVLRARHPGPDAIAQLRELTGIAADSPARIAVTMPAEVGAPWPDAARSLSRLRFVGATHVSPEHVAVLVLPGGAGEAVARTRPDGAAVGISAPAPLTAEGITRQHAAAVLAAGCASVDPGLPRVVGWTELGIYRRLLETTRPSTWTDVPLLPDSPMLEQTLEAYLDNAGDAARTTTALNIHRTTLYYRLGRLGSEHGIDLHDGAARTDLHVALKLRRLALARGRCGWTDALIAHVAT